MTASPVALQPGTWDYLQNHYSGYLSLTCDPEQPTGGNYSACIGVKNAKIDGFKNDVTALPESQFKTDLLVVVVAYIASYRNYVDAMCTALDPTQPPCLETAQGLQNSFTLMGTIVNRATAG